MKKDMLTTLTNSLTYKTVVEIGAVKYVGFIERVADNCYRPRVIAPNRVYEGKELYKDLLNAAIVMEEFLLKARNDESDTLSK